MEQQDCIFCKIANKEISAELIAETNSLVAVKDINPSADVHILIISKTHIPSFLELDKESDYLVDAVGVAHELIKKFDVANAFKMVFNGGKYPHVKHLHWHILGGEIKNHV